ncbi:NADPH:quinone reductase-like Zn-dependent oxidoreductase [Catenulispora sp. GP43]
MAATRWLFEVPDVIELEHAVPVFQAGALALGMLSAMRLAAGETILITAAAGRIGSLLVQAAKAAGATVVGGVGGGGFGVGGGGSAKAQAVKALGADEVVDYSHPDWVEQVRALAAGHGADLASPSPNRTPSSAPTPKRHWPHWPPDASPHASTPRSPCRTHPWPTPTSKAAGTSARCC